MDSYRDVLDRLARAHPTLSPQVRKAAGYVLENPGSIATLSMRKAAAEAKVPPPTLPRLAQALGFSTYESFRDVFRHHMQGQSTGYPEQANQLQRLGGTDDSASLMAAFQAASLSNIDYLFSTIDHDLIDTIADKLLSARTVFIIGMQASFAAAAYVHYVGRMAYPNWVLLDKRDGDLADRAVEMGEEDVLLAISMPPSAKESILMAQHARNNGTTVVGITNSRVSPLASRSDHILVVPMQSPQFFESFVSTVLLLETIVGFAVAKGGDAAVRNIEDVERCRRALDEYWEKE